MIDLDQRAREAGAGLRAWDPGTPFPTASAVATRAVRRTRRRRAAAGTVLLGAIAGIGLMWGGLRHDGDSVRTGSVTTAPSDPHPPTSVPAPSPTTSVVPEATTPSPPVGPSEPGPSVRTCRGEVGGVVYEVTLPDVWYVNEAQDRLPPCWLFAPYPVEARLGPTEGDPDISSNAVISFVQPYPPDAPPPGSFDQRMADIASRADVLDSQRTTIDGRPAARFERIAAPGDGQPGGERYTRWYIDLGAVELWVSTMTPGDSYDEAVAALDLIVTSMRFTG